MKVREIDLKMNRNLMAVRCDVRTCVLSVYYIDKVYIVEFITKPEFRFSRVLFLFPFGFFFVFL